MSLTLNLTGDFPNPFDLAPSNLELACGRPQATTHHLLEIPDVLDGEPRLLAHIRSRVQLEIIPEDGSATANSRDQLKPRGLRKGFRAGLDL